MSSNWIDKALQQSRLVFVPSKADTASKRNIYEAKQHIIITGVEAVLRQKPFFNHLIDHIIDCGGYAKID